MTYIVESFGAAGCYEPPRHVEFATLAAARAEARSRLGLLRLHPARKGGCGGDLNGAAEVEAWCEYTHRQDPYGHRSGAVGIWRSSK